MRRILAIAGLAVRAAIRSRLVICLLLLLLAAVVGLPLIVQSDGTPEGHVRIVIGYTMGFASLVLSLTALWSGALSIAREVDEKQIQLLCSKPVHRLEIWFGKWLGLTTVHVALLALSAVATYLALELSVRGERFNAAQRMHLREDVLTARRAVLPEPFEVEAAARAEVKRRMEQGQVPDGVRPEVLLQNLRQELLIQAHTISPGAQQTWTFKLPPGVTSPSELRLKVLFSTSRMGTTPVRGTLLAGSSFRIVTTNAPDSAHFIALPASATGGNSTLVVRYINDDPDPVTVVFPLHGGLELQIPAGGFAGNFAWAVLVIAFRLALLCAIGITASTLFSTPVAALMALAAVIILQAGSYVGSLAQQERLTPWSRTGEVAPGLVEVVLRNFYRLLDLVLAPLQTGRPLDNAATGIWVDPAFVARTGLVQVLVYGGLLALLATFVFNRRELARPNT